MIFFSFKTIQSNSRIPYLIVISQMCCTCKCRRRCATCVEMIAHESGPFDCDSFVCCFLLSLDTHHSLTCSDHEQFPSFFYCWLFYFFPHKLIVNRILSYSTQSWRHQSKLISLFDKRKSDSIFGHF